MEDVLHELGQTRHDGKAAPVVREVSGGHGVQSRAGENGLPRYFH
jgi:hypothetical protein